MPVKTIYITVIRKNGFLDDSEAVWTEKKAAAENELNDALNAGFTILKSKACDTAAGTAFVYQLWKSDQETPHSE